MSIIEKHKWISLKAGGEGIPLTAQGSTFVCSVQGGWLLRYKYFGGRGKSANSLIFIPDPDHEWKSENNNGTWEKVCKISSPNFRNSTERLKVYNGWAYKDSDFDKVNMCIAMVYISTPK